MISAAKDEITAAAKALVIQAQAKGLTIATAESCTGGLIGGAITVISGASSVFMGGIIAYDNRIKEQVLQVPNAVLSTHGAVSRRVAQAMAHGAILALDVDLAVSVTGIAGPGGGSAEKPVGTVWIGTARRNSNNDIIAEAHLYQFGDIGRENIRAQTCLEALKQLKTNIA